MRHASLEWRLTSEPRRSWERLSVMNRQRVKDDEFAHSCGAAWSAERDKMASHCLKRHLSSHNSHIFTAHIRHPSTVGPRPASVTSGRPPPLFVDRLGERCLASGASHNSCENREEGWETACLRLLPPCRWPSDRVIRPGSARRPVVARVAPAVTCVVLRTALIRAC